MWTRRYGHALVVACAFVIGTAVDARAQTAAYFFEDINYDGDAALAYGSVSWVGNDWNDRISSVWVPPGRTVILYEHINFGGASLMLTGDNPDLRWFAGPGTGGTWNDAASSFEIIDPPPAATATTVMVNGSFNTYPNWVLPGPEYYAIQQTMGAPPIHFPWTQNNDVEFWNGYAGIVAGGYDLANFLSALPEGDVNVVAHSHGGNVVIWATHLMNRPIRHLINLGTPINEDLWRYLGGQSAYSHCQVSSPSDDTQFYGASPYQVAGYWDGMVRGASAESDAYQAMLDGRWDDYYYYLNQANFWYAVADNYWWSTKYEWSAPTYLYWGASHADLHEPPVWNAIANVCALN
jgi:hypothetical protein